MSGWMEKDGVRAVSGPLEFQRACFLAMVRFVRTFYSPNRTKIQEQKTDNKAKGMLFTSSIAEFFFTRVNTKKEPTSKNAGTILRVMLVFPRNDVTTHIRKYV